MPSRSDKNKFIHNALIATFVSLASCGRIDAAADAGAKPSRQASTAHTANAADDLAQPTPVEQRHFAIYSAYRLLFDDAPDRPPPRVDRGNVNGLPMCSMQSLPMRQE